MKSITIENLKFSYDGKTRILDGINLEIEAGQYVGITGDSGCGKSTLCHILSGIIPYAISGIVSGNVVLRKSLNKDECVSEKADSGQVEIEELNLKNCRLSDLSEMLGFVMQDSDRQIVSSTVEDELAFGPENMCIEPEEIRRRVDETAELLGLGDLLLHNPNNLSGGQKQLVAIGSVLTLRPEILILDEPFSHLDEEAKDNLKSIIMNLKKLGKTIIVVEHDHTAIEAADRHICIKNGKIEREY